MAGCKGILRGRRNTGNYLNESDMKKLYKVPILFLSGVLLLLSTASCTKNTNGPGTINTNNGQGLATISGQIYNFPKDSLNESERKSLLFIREEEKLARDVYTALYTQWGTNVFSNISASEQTHMDAILILLNRYAITDPAGAPGVFVNTTLQSLYHQLVQQGSKSILDAYKVGATIEDLDIYDIENSIEGIDNKDILWVYASLTKGSRNHLRSYFRNIVASGSTYTPQYISQSEFDNIINSPMETGF